MSGFSQYYRLVLNFSDRNIDYSVSNSSPIADPDLLVLHEQAILREFLDTIDSDDSDDDVSSVYSVCSNCKHPAKKGEDLKRCSRCHITRYCSVECQRKDWDFHRFACAVVAKKSDTVKA